MNLVCENRSKFHPGETNGRNHRVIIPHRWDCKYHIVFIPKCRRTVLYRELRKYLGEMFRNLDQQKEGRIEEGHWLGDHVHMAHLDPAVDSHALVVKRSGILPN